MYTTLDSVSPQLTHLTPQAMARAGDASPIIKLYQVFIESLSLWSWFFNLAMKDSISSLT
tara:strand:- start:539 stop:718 length:180 start_codon:yes stop_codon:yes gene_type:complete